MWFHNFWDSARSPAISANKSTPLSRCARSSSRDQAPEGWCTVFDIALIVCTFVGTERARSRRTPSSSGSDIEAPLPALLLHHNGDVRWHTTRLLVDLDSSVVAFSEACFTISFKFIGSIWVLCSISGMGQTFDVWSFGVQLVCTRSTASNNFLRNSIHSKGSIYCCSVCPFAYIYEKKLMFVSFVPQSKFPLMVSHQ